MRASKALTAAAAFDGTEHGVTDWRLGGEPGGRKFHATDLMAKSNVQPQDPTPTGRVPVKSIPFPPQS